MPEISNSCNLCAKGRITNVAAHGLDGNWLGFTLEDCPGMCHSLFFFSRK